MCSPIHYSSIDHSEEEDRKYYNLDETMFNKKLLFVPNNICETDENKIYKYFTYFNIAKIKNVEIIKYYNVEDCYAIIEIEKWNINRTSINFYNSIIDNKCKMIYDDPHFWELYVYDFVDDYYYYIDNKEELNILYENIRKNSNKLNENENKDNSENIIEDNSENIIEDNSENIIEDNSEYNYIFEESDTENDDESLDKDYVYSEDELNEYEKYYEYTNKTYESQDKKSQTYKKKKRKYNVNLELSNTKDELSNTKEELINLKKILIKKNKNYLKNNKSKDYKNSWTRRLRQKQVLSNK
jgi:hypothetical protein